MDSYLAAFGNDATAAAAAAAAATAEAKRKRDPLDDVRADGRVGVCVCVGGGGGR